MSLGRRNQRFCTSGEQFIYTLYPGILSEEYTSFRIRGSSPACILSFFITAVIRGEFKEAWNWSDDPEENKKESDDSPPMDTNTKSKED